ncbi:MAG: galactokinase [Noviherbaspirillum sp.]
MSAPSCPCSADSVLASAPGRVNLLGEHTDYNDGYVLPVAIPQRTYVQASLSSDGRFHAYSQNLDENVAFDPEGELPDGFARYVGGCVRILRDHGIAVPPLCLKVHSEVPMGAGLSSSAALEVALLRALRQLLGLDLDDVQIAQYAQAAEIGYAGVQCGIMDQMAASLADTGHMLFLDTRTLERRLLPLPPGSGLIVIDSGVARTLATSKYNERFAQCREAARLLGVPMLRDIADASALAGLPCVLQRRARHVVTENARVRAAVAEGVDGPAFGRLMNASHASLRDDYEVSVPALDILCDMLRARPGVYGARLTGAGFGGACVALCERERAAPIAADVTVRYNRDRRRQQASVLLPAPSPGAGAGQPQPLFNSPG